MSSGSACRARRPSRDNLRMAAIKRSMRWVDVLMKPSASPRSWSICACRGWSAKASRMSAWTVSSSPANPITFTSGARRSWLTIEANRWISSLDSRSWASASLCSVMSVWTPDPLADRTFLVEGRDGADGVLAPSAIAGADPVLEHECAPLAHRGAPGLERRVRVLRMDRARPAVSFVLGPGLPGDRRPPRLAPQSSGPSHRSSRARLAPPLWRHGSALRFRADPSAPRCWSHEDVSIATKRRANVVPATARATFDCEDVMALPCAMRPAPGSGVERGGGHARVVHARDGGAHHGRGSEFLARRRDAGRRGAGLR